MDSDCILFKNWKRDKTKCKAGETKGSHCIVHD
jgi:hypothetical protein